MVATRKPEFDSSLERIYETGLNNRVRFLVVVNL
jgi:hypothetical protein